MIKKILLGFIGILLVVAAAGAAYIYYVTPAVQNSSSSQPATVPLVQPDNSVEAGLVMSVSTTSISFIKQDGTTATFTIATTTRIVLAGQGSSTPQTVSRIKKGTMVLVTPNADQTSAQTIIIVTPPPTQQ